MTVMRYRFGAFLLDPQARELLHDGERVALPVSHLDCLVYLIRHRDRPVGRDELAAAVWDRTDVSDVSVNHAIMRLRKVLGDTGSEQHAIRTLPRVGYRWLLEVIEDAAGSAADSAVIAAPGEESAGSVRETTLAIGLAQRSDDPAADTTMSGPAATRVHGVRSSRTGISILAVVIVVLAALAFGRAWLSAPELPQVIASSAPDAGEEVMAVEAEHVALVLPAVAPASGEWAWLRLGLMDLVAGRLRDSGLAVTPSETVVNLVAATGLADAAEVWPDERLTNRGTLMIRPQAVRGDGHWQVRLHYREGTRLQMVEASHADVLVAARLASDYLAVRRGLVPVLPEGGPVDQFAEQASRRIHAAVLAGQLDVARQLIMEAPIEVKNDPEIVLSQAAIDFFAGDYAASITGAETAIAQLTDGSRPRLLARAWQQLGTSHVRQRRIDEADGAFGNVIELLRDLNDPDTLAAAYTGRGIVAGMRLQLDEATSLLGRARVLHQMANNAFGVVRVDMNLAALAMDRGQPATALPILEGALERLELMAVPEARIYTLRGMVDAQLMLLQAPAALTTSERFWPPEHHSDNARERWWLYLSRAVALAASGRLAEAQSLADEVATHSDPEQDRFVRTETRGLAAVIALLRGDNSQAAAISQEALGPVLEQSNRLSHATIWLTRTRALQRAGRLDEAADDVARMRGWASRQPADWRMLYVILAEAEQAHVEGRIDNALAGYDQAMAMADSVAIPESQVVVGESWIDALIQSGQVDRASDIGGRLSQWAERDWRAAWAQARFYHAVGRADQAEELTARARALAGERVLPDPLRPIGLVR